MKILGVGSLRGVARKKKAFWEIKPLRNLDWLI